MPEMPLRNALLSHFKEEDHAAILRSDGRDFEPPVLRLVLKESSMGDMHAFEIPSSGHEVAGRALAQLFQEASENSLEVPRLSSRWPPIGKPGPREAIVRAHVTMGPLSVLLKRLKPFLVVLEEKDRF